MPYNKGWSWVGFRRMHLGKEAVTYMNVPLPKQKTNEKTCGLAFRRFKLPKIGMGIRKL